MATLIQLRHDTAAAWASVNPVLAAGELGLTTDTGVYKIGDGTTAWNSLSYAGLTPTVTTLDTVVTTNPGAAASGHMTVYSKYVSGRAMLKAVGPSGLDYAAQPWMARNKIGVWQPQGNSTVLPGVFGYTGPTIVGTLTSRNVATTNGFNMLRRIGIVTAATAGSLASYRIAAAQVTTGTGSGGGFHKIMRFGISDAVLVSGARMFMGMSSSTSAPTNVEPSTLTNSIGIGHGAADTNMMLFYGGSTKQTPINLGANFPIDTNTSAYELALFSPPSGAGEINYEVTNLNNGYVATGTITPAGGVALPGSTTLLSYAWGYRTNNATAAAVGLDIAGDYIETDN